MKKKLLWIWIPSVLIIAVAGFVFFNMKSWEIDQDIIVNVEPEQEILPYHRVGEDEIWWEYLSPSECYDEEWNINDNPNTDKYGSIVNCYDINGNEHWQWIYSIDWQVIPNFDYESNALFISYKNWESPNNQQDDIYFQIISNYKKDILRYNSKWKNIEIVWYYDNWQIASKWQINGWEIEWKHTLYYKNWQVAIEIEFKNWLENWKYISYYRNWKTIEEWEFLNWQKYWKWIEYYNNWQIFREWDMVNWQYSWEYAMYNFGWKVSEEWEFLNWQKHWRWVTYENWQIVTSGSYIYWLQNGERVSYYANWWLRWIVSFVNWKKDWKWVEYYENWQTYQENIYKNWELEDEILYYNNWQKMLENIYNGGKIIESKYYDEDWNLVE